MESYEALGNAIGRSTTAHAKGLGVSVSLVSKWKEPSVDFSESGALNPLDRIETIMRTAKGLGVPDDMALSPVFYLGERFGFVPMLLPQTPEDLAHASRLLNKVVSEFGDVIRESAGALEDGKVTPDERKTIEREAQQLFAVLGQFLSQIREAAK